VDDERVLVLSRMSRDGTAALGLLNFSHEGRTARVELPAGEWQRLVDSAEERFGGFGPKTPQSVNLRRRGKAEIDMLPWGAAIFLRSGRRPSGHGAVADGPRSPDARGR
jgi:maltooligosyltrehalose trehalohydrolase